MPTKTKQDIKGCYAQWGEHGAKYYYICGNEEARQNAVDKANTQARAIKSESLAKLKVSFDYDGVLSTNNGKELAKQRISNGDEVYIITGRMESDKNSDIYSISKELGIDRNHIYFTNHKDKWEQVKHLNIDTHYDNNAEQIDKINKNTDTKGILI